MKIPVVSVIVPVYNAEKYIRQAVESILNQTNVNIELICVDDGSSDNSYELLCEYSASDDRMIVLKNLEQSDGAAQARNIGMSVANGEYLAFLDADDYADLNMIEESYKFAKENDADIVMFDAWYYDENIGSDFATRNPLNMNYIPNKRVFSPIENKEYIFLMTHGAVWGRLFRKEFITKNELSFFSCHYWDDIEFFYVAICLASRIAVLNKKLMHYRYNADGNQTSTISRYPEIACKATIELLNRFIKYGIYKEYETQLINMLVSRVFSMLHRIDEWESFKNLFWNLKNGKLEEIGAYRLDKDSYYDKRLVAYIKLIENVSGPEEYLVKKGALFIYEYEKGLAKLSKLTNGSAKVILYGAGICGMTVFGRLMNNPLYTIVGWCDINYKNIGYPIENPESIKSKSYDYIIITIKDERIVEQVIQYLQELGVNKNKILEYLT